MSHGRLIGLDTPDEIKRRFGVGYNVYLEPKHHLADQMDEGAIKLLFDKARRIFLGHADMEGIEESLDSNDKKLIFMVPSAYVYKMADVVALVETEIQEL